MLMIRTTIYGTVVRSRLALPNIAIVGELCSH